MPPDDEDDLVARIVNEAKTVATVGAKGEGDAPAFTVPRRMRQVGIRIIPVNPTISEAFGEPARATLADVREPIDVVQIFRRAEFIEGIADEVLTLPTEMRPKVFWMQSGLRHERAAEKLRAAGITVVEDRCFAVEIARTGRRGNAGAPGSVPWSEC